MVSHGTRALALAATLLSAPALAANVLVYADDDQTVQGVFVERAAQRAGHVADVYLLDGPGFRAAFLAGGYDAIAIESIAHALPTEVGDVLRWAIGDGVPVLFSHYDLEWAFAAQIELGVEAWPLTAPPSSIQPPANDPYGLFDGIPAGLTPHPNDALVDNGDTIGVTRNGTVEGTSPQGGVIAVTYGGRVITNGFMHLDYRGMDGDGDGVIDVEELLANELDAILAAAAALPRLVISGTCPGTMTLEIEGLAPNAPVAIARALTRGAQAVPTGPCAGTVLDLSPNQLKLIGTFRANAQGRFTATPTIPSPMCVQFIQAVDAARCVTTNPSSF